jgi:hypothetical protein
MTTTEKLPFTVKRAIELTKPKQLDLGQVVCINGHPDIDFVITYPLLMDARRRGKVDRNYDSDQPRWDACCRDCTFTAWGIGEHESEGLNFRTEAHEHNTGHRVDITRSWHVSRSQTQ